jgi:quinolinate synthase
MARILCEPRQKVFHPEPSAKCPLAEMALIDDVEKAWELLTATGGDTSCPSYTSNSRADLQGFCGKKGGFVCTSANAKEAMEYVPVPGRHPLLLP